MTGASFLGWSRRIGCLSLSIFLCACAAHQNEPPTAASGSPGTTSVFNIVSYGAVADGTTMNTAAIQKAIDACAAAGGGRVELPAGTFLSGPIHLASNIDFHLDDGALLIFSPHFDDYPMVLANFMGKDTVQCTSPITARDCQNLSITGHGIIDGQGQFWRPVKKWKVTQEQWDDLVKSGGAVDNKSETWWPSEAAMKGDKGLTKLRESDDPPTIDQYAAYRDLLRPILLELINCKSLLLDGPTIRNSPFWAVHVLWCDGVIVRNVTIYNDLSAQNGDGIGFDSTRNVLMENSKVFAGDDNITCKSGKDAEGRKRHLPTENVVIRHCISAWGHGGFVLGSETSGDIRNIEISDCICDGTDVGLRFKSVRGRGGIVENIRVKNITMSNIQKSAISFDMYYEQAKDVPEPRSERTPLFRNFDIQDISCLGAQRSIWIHGLPELPLSNVTMTNMHLVSDEGAMISEAAGIKLKDVQLESRKGPAITIQNVSAIDLDGMNASINPGNPTTQPSTQPTLMLPR